MEQIGNTIGAHQATNLLPHLAAFLAVVEAGSFTAAGRRAGVDKTQISRRVRTLEDALRVRLLNRTTRRIHVTDAGRALAEAASGPVMDAVQALQLAASPEHVSGTVRVTSIPETADEIWAPVLRTLADSHPGLHVELSATETMVDLVDRGIDLAVRIGRMPDSSLVMRRLATWRYVLCASPGWLTAHSDVRTPADLSSYWVLYGDVARPHRWRFEAGSSTLTVEVGSVFTTDSGLLQRAALLAGIGVSAMAPFSVGDALRDGRLVRVLPEWRVADPLGIFGVTPHRSYLPGRVEVVLDAVGQRLAALEPGWQELTG